MSKAPISERKLHFIAILVTLAALVAGLGVFYARYAYAEPGHNYLSIAYLVGCIILFFSIRLWNIPLLLGALVLMTGTQIYAGNKFDWRQNYIELANMGQPFFLEEFIDHYPTYEEHVFTFLKAPDWVGFNDTCVQPALHNQVILPRCASIELISRYYNIDISEVMMAYFARMKNTAKMVESGQMKKRSQYAQCIADKSCATIPLLPKGVDAEKLDPSSRDYIGVRQAFWSLINDKKMSAEVCSLTPLCRALVTMKAVDPARLPF